MATSRPVRAACCLALALAGCAVGPDYRAPAVASPARWAEAGGRPPVRPDLAAWWERFDDPLLTRLIERAVAGNLDVATAKARVREVRALRDEVAASSLPQVDASASVGRSRSAAQTGGIPASTSNLFEAGFDASWDLDLFGGIARTVEAREDAAEAAGEGLRAGAEHGSERASARERL